MGRITKVKGEFMGVGFEVKPTPIRFDKVIEDRRQMLLNWYKEKHPKTHKKIISDTVSFEDYNVKQGIAGDQFDLKVDSLGDALEMKSDSALDTFGRSNLQSGYQNTVMDTLQDQYSDGIASAELKYDQSTFANTQNLRQELSQYQTTYNSLGQYTNDLSYNFMENYKKLIG